MWRHERGRWAIIVPPRGLQILWLIVVQESWSVVQGGAGRCRAGRAHTKTITSTLPRPKAGLPSGGKAPPYGRNGAP